MDPAWAKKELLKLAERLDIELRYSPAAPSGLCTVKGKRVLYINTSDNTDTLVDLLVREFRNFDLEDMYIVPGLRGILENESDE